MPFITVDNQVLPTAILFMPDGWAVDERARWVMTRRGRSLSQLGRVDARRHLWEDDEADGATDSVQGVWPYNLPIVAVCPSCRTPLALTTERLAVDPHRHEHRLTNLAQLDGSVVRRVCCNDGTHPGVHIQVPIEWTIGDGRTSDL